MRYLAGGGDPRFLDAGSRLNLEPLAIDLSDRSAAYMIAFNNPGTANAKRIMPDLDLPKPEYLHTIKLATPKVVKTTAVGTTYKAAKP